jgi:predicted nuclease of predicted toxin-antitoxin system
LKFLLNVNLPRSLARALGDEGHSCRHAADIGLAKAADTAIVNEARTGGEIIMTHDLDYGHLLAFSGEATPSVIIFRVRNSHPENLLRRFMSAWPEIEAALRSGAIVAVEDAGVRIRALPVLKDDA